MVVRGMVGNGGEIREELSDMGIGNISVDEGTVVGRFLSFPGI